MTGRYDVLVIGSGVSGQTVAQACAEGGRKVAVVDARPFGGTCSLRGCMPKKVLYSAAEAASRASMLAEKGMHGPQRVRWPELMAHKRSYTGPVPHDMEAWFAGMGVDVLHGTARFVSPDEMELEGSRMGADAFVVAAGAKPMPLGIPGEDLVATSEDFLDLDHLPDRIAFIGGGYISFEFAGIASRAGAEVTIVHRSSDLLGGFEETLVATLADRYRRLGIRILTDSPVVAVERSGAGRAVVTPGARIEADLVVHGAGRVPDLDALHLDEAGVERTGRGVTVHPSMRSTTNPRVWAIGDAAALGMPLTPVGVAQGEIAAAGILGNEGAFDGAVTPSVVFADPPLARVGLGADEAAGDPRYEVRTFDMGRWFSQSRLGNDCAGAVIVTDTARGTIAGAHLLGFDADEVINIFALAIRFGLTIEQLKTMTWSYPTLSYEINYLTGRF